MSDAEKSDLAVLVQGTDRKATITDRFGKVHDLAPLTVEDLNEFEQRIGRTLIGANPSTFRLADITHLVWLSLRKEGKSEEQVDRREWACTERQIMKMFDAGFWSSAGQHFTDVMKVSGFRVQTDPQKAGQKKARQMEGPDEPLL